MPNEFHNITNNNYYTKGNTFQTQIIRYDRPVYVVLGGYIEEMYAMVIANTYKVDKEGRESIVTYRIPLTGITMEAWNPRKMDAKIVTLPSDKKITADAFKEYIEYIVSDISLDEGLTLLESKGFTVQAGDEPITVRVSAYENLTHLYSPWFNLTIGNSDKIWYSPNDVLDLCRISKFLKKTFKFVPEDNQIEYDRMGAMDLERLMTAFKRHGFYTNDKVTNDGTYTFGKDLGRIRMKREDFIKQFEGAYPIFKD